MEHPGYSILVCSDPEILREKLAELLENSGPWERAVFWGDEDPSPAFWECLVQQGLFATNRAVIVRNAQNWSAGVWQKLSHAMTRAFSSIWPFFCLEGSWEKRKPSVPAWIVKQDCYQLADKRGWIWLQPPLQGADLKQFITRHSRKLQLKWEPAALAEFSSMVRPDASLIKNELGRLALVANGQPVTSQLLCADSGNLENNAFVCVRNILAGNLEGAWKEMGDGNSMLFFLLALLERELRILWDIQAGNPVRLYPQEAGLKKALAQRLGFPGISQGLVALAEAEWQVKSGQATTDQALEWLVCNLAMLFGSPERVS